jgi:glutamate-1-semialdehyde 2,1-aminomutase
LFSRINNHAARLARVVNEQAKRKNIPVCANQLGPVLQLFAGATEVPTVRDLQRVDGERTLDLTSELLRQGVYSIPRGLMYLSAAHTDMQIERTERSLVAALEHLGPPAS